MPVYVLLCSTALPLLGTPAIIPGPGFLSNTALLLWFTNSTPDSTLIRTLIPLVIASGSSPSLLSVSSAIYVIVACGTLCALKPVCFPWPRFASLLLAFAGFPSIQGTFPISHLCTYLFIGQYHLYNIAHHIKTYYVAMYKSPRAYAIIHTRICPFSHHCRLATSDMCGCSYFG
ncbi:hypothetical protein EDB85DRAFT_556739 [Lactarius pseudohatsudake]|nr:hypothetical protein EDB85DRAFT_556739 [Lactarius pseudohatsudake]